ncbi:MAG TPA: TRAP transporter small permease [Peptococcaceae bacterium]|nr:MAG: C4-dicarboxylate transport system permease small protein [Moorella sp. 60_41]HBT46288.1 TRAP transporter small permease [Peptococcaceae bacterium]
MIARVLRLFDYFEDGLNGSLLLLATGILFVNVILRYFGRSTTWAEEAIRYIIVWITFVGGSICARQGDHVGIEVFTSFAPANIQRGLKTVAELTSIVFLSCLTYYGWMAMQTVIVTNQRSPAMLIPMWIVYLALPLGSALMALRYVHSLINCFRANSGETLDKNGNDVTQL